MSVASTSARTRRRTHTPTALAMLQSVQREPIFGGYGLIGVVVAWVVGIALRSQTRLVLLDGRVWLVVGVVAAVRLDRRVARR